MTDLLREQLKLIQFPNVPGMDSRDMTNLSNLFRWFVLYRKCTNNPLFRPVGSLCEITCFLDLVSSAWLDYSIRVEIRAEMDEVLVATCMLGDFTKMVQRLKQRAWGLFLASIPPCMVKKEETYRMWPCPLEQVRETKQKVWQVTIKVPYGLPADAKGDLNQMFRWLALYRTLTRDHFPAPSGTLCEVSCFVLVAWRVV